MKLHFLLNKTARTGGSAAVWKEIQTILADENIEYEVHPTDYPHAATDIAEKLSGLEDASVNLIVIGGDGTVNEVINGIRNFEKIRLGIIPAGSGNDFARGLGKPKGLEAFRGILDSLRREEAGETLKKIDLGEAGHDGASRLFAISAGIGLDAIVCKKALQSGLKKLLNRLHLGQLTYILLTVETLFSMKTSDVDVIFGTDGKTRHVKKVIFGAGMNLFAEGGGVPMAPHADPADGQLSLCLAYGIPKIVTFFCLPLLMAAKHERIKGFSIWNCPSFTLHSSEPMTLHTDGEYGGEVTDVTFRCLKQRLTVL